MGPSVLTSSRMLHQATGAGRHRRRGRRPKLCRRSALHLRSHKRGDLATLLQTPRSTSSLVARILASGQRGVSHKFLEDSVTYMHGRNLLVLNMQTNRQNCCRNTHSSRHAGESAPGPGVMGATIFGRLLNWRAL